MRFHMQRMSNLPVELLEHLLLKSQTMTSIATSEISRDVWADYPLTSHPHHAIYIRQSSVSSLWGCMVRNRRKWFAKQLSKQFDFCLFSRLRKCACAKYCDLL